MKPAIFYAIVKRWGKCHILDVTSTKGPLYRRILYGRDAEGMTTHVSGNDMVARFRTREEAESCLQEATNIVTKYKIAGDVHRALLANLSRQESQELQELWKKTVD